MNTSAWTGIELFVEGEEDELFVRRILEPRLAAHYLHVGVYQYAQRSSERLEKHFRSLTRMQSTHNLTVFLLTDCEVGRCIRSVRQAIAQEYPHFLKESQVLVVRPEIEAWYCAGIPTPNPFKAEIPASVEQIDKETFAQLLGERAVNRLERKILLAEILERYDWQLALQRSASLRYCAGKLGI